MATTTTPKKVVFDPENICPVCLKKLVTIVGGKKVTARRRDLTFYKPLLSDLKELFPEIVFGSRKAFICEECFNKLQKFLRVKGKLKSVETEYEQEKNTFISLYSKNALPLRQKRILSTPQRPRHQPKQLRGDPSKSPSKIPVFILPKPGLGKENIPLSETKAAVFHRSFQKDVQLSASKIPVPYQAMAKEKMQNPRAIKSRKMLLLSDHTQEKTNVHVVSEIQKNQFNEPNFQAQIQYTYPSQTRKKIVDTNETYLKLVRAMIDERPQQISNAVCKDPQIRPHILGEICEMIKEESESLCKIKTQSVLQNVAAEQLQKLKWTNLIEEWKAKAPTLLSFLTAVSCDKELSETNVANIAFAGSVLLRARNQKMSAVSHIIGLLLDYGGAHDSTIKKLAALGASVSPTTITRKKTEISQLHDKDLNAQLQQYNSNISHIAESIEVLHELESISLDSPCITQTVCSPKLESTQVLPSTQILPSTQACTSSQSSSFVTSFVMSGPLYTLAKQPTCCRPSLTVTPVELNRICNYTEQLSSTEVSDTFKNRQIVSETLFTGSGKTDIIHTSFADTRSTRKNTKNFLLHSRKELEAQSYVRKEIYGDNCDIRVNVGHQTKQNRTKDYHWFITLAADLRVEGHGLNEKRPQLPIHELKNIEFLPSNEDNASLKRNFKHHVLKVITENIDSLNGFQSIVPKCIHHKHMEEMKKKGNYELIDLHNKNESKSEDMIDILSDIHKLFVPAARNSSQVISRIVFGGDVLTNERAYQAQLDMINGDTAHEKLLDIIHRPEGLHRLMNFMLYIFETFYLTSSVNDRGTMYQLKCFLDRRDIKLDMTAAYRQCKNFFYDVLDGHLTAAACHYFGISDTSSVPVKNCMPYILEHSSKENQLDWLEGVANDILDIYVFEQSRAVPDIYEDTDYMESQLESLQTRSPEKMFCCPNCQKTYKQLHWLKRHMKDKHGVTINLNPPQRSDKSSEYDGIFNVASAFLKVGLLFRDTDDAYKMGDGNRLIRNAKYELLHFNQGHHIKYRLWMWRMLAYTKSLLSEKEAYEYMWNMSFNFGQGLGHLIPNDNLVEINVHLMKEQCRRMGANVTYEGARKWVKCLKFLHDLSEEFDRFSCIKRSSSKHTHADRQAEICAIVKELTETNVFEFQPGRVDTA